MSCYKTITKKDHFGHRGVEGLTHKRCPPSILCGREQCENIETIPSLK